MDRISIANELQNKITEDFRQRMVEMEDEEDRIRAALRDPIQPKPHTSKDSAYDLSLAVESLFNPELCDDREEEDYLEFENLCADHPVALSNVEANMVLPDLQSLRTLEPVLPKCTFVYLPTDAAKQLEAKPLTLVCTKIESFANIPFGSRVITTPNTGRVSILNTLIKARINSQSYGAG